MKLSLKHHHWVQAVQTSNSYKWLWCGMMSMPLSRIWTDSQHCLMPNTMCCGTRYGIISLEWCNGMKCLASTTIFPSSFISFFLHSKEILCPFCPLLVSLCSLHFTSTITTLLVELVTILHGYHIVCSLYYWLPRGCFVISWCRPLGCIMRKT